MPREWPGGNPTAAAVSRRQGSGRTKKELAALFRYVNAHGIQVSDTAQWTSWVTLQHPSGLQRFRYAMWELRNQRTAAHVMDVAASMEPERVLFIVGYAHKAYVEGAPEPQLTIRLVQPQSYGPWTGPGRWAPSPATARFNRGNAQPVRAARYPSICPVTCSTVASTGHWHH